MQWKSPFKKWGAIIFQKYTDLDRDFEESFFACVFSSSLSLSLVMNGTDLWNWVVKWQITPERHQLLTKGRNYSWMEQLYFEKEPMIAVTTRVLYLFLRILPCSITYGTMKRSWLSLCRPPLLERTYRYANCSLWLGSIEKYRQILFASNYIEGRGKFLAGPENDFCVLHNSSNDKVSCAAKLF